MAGLKSALIFLSQSIIVGLSVAFLVVLFLPQWLPINTGIGSGQPASYANAVDISAPAVANVYTKQLVQSSATPDARNRFRLNTNLGSAVVIDAEGYLVTNYHVVAGAAEIRVQMSDGRIADPIVVGYDAETDLALLKVDLGIVPAIPLGRSDQLRIGDVVLAIGNPYGLSKTVTQGIVSATGRGLLGLSTFENFIQTDAAINTGNSGGALVNSLGQLVGINTAVLAEDAGTAGISFAIPVDLVRGVVQEIKENGRVIRGWLGLEPDDLTPAEFKLLGLDSNVGILLSAVFPDSPAAAAGLQRNDVILTINGEPIQSGQQARLLVAGLRPREMVEVVGWRNGRRFTANMLAGERPQEK